MSLLSRVARNSVRSVQTVPTARTLATASPVNSAARSHRTVIIGGGTAGLAISHQLLRSGHFVQDDIAIVDPAEWHHYQPGWTLVGSGLKTKQELRRPLKSLIDPKIKFYNDGVSQFVPEQNAVKLANGDLTYEHLIVAPGIKVNFESIKGLPEALANPDALVSSIYGYDSVDKKIMWLALDHWKKTGLYKYANSASSDIRISFATGLGGMFAVPKYSAKLEELRQERGVEGLFQHDLVAIEGNTAIFARPDGQEQVKKHFDLLHAVPKMGPHEFVKSSPLANEAGFVDVNEGTTRHKKFANVWSAGDASSLPTSKTGAAITAEAPVLVRNVIRALEGKEPDAIYDGYASCPLLTEYGKVLLAEFKYGGVPKETFGFLGIDQAVPRREFYYMKKDFFPWVYYKSLVKGTWGGPKGWINPGKA
ncbi:Cadmium resistance protein 1 [Cladobotryum mycophilum]|uniref:Cadmium resistance protein 1 n=1 Tax=Cladobotryum mycophilum TaxID=491253 RepID=A0ABR0S920_9HYPO